MYGPRLRSFFFFFNDTATTEIYTLSLHDALPISMDVSRARARRDARGLADILGQTRRHATEIPGQESREPVALRVLEHLEQHPELDAVGMRLDLARRLRHLVVRPGMLLGFPFRRQVRQLDVRIRDDRLLDVFVHRGAA